VTPIIRGIAQPSVPQRIASAKTDGWVAPHVSRGRALGSILTLERLDMSAHAKRILVVDDDAQIRSALTEMLDDEGYASLSASNGAEALSLLRSHHSIGLVLLDLMMPVMNGHEFLAEQRRDPALADIPVVAISADIGGLRQKLQATAVLSKPFSCAQLLSKIEACLALLPARSHG
jgi:CheY-like chemotaxis protein